jgi:hypothetical protein
LAVANDEIRQPSTVASGEVPSRTTAGTETEFPWGNYTPKALWLISGIALKWFLKYMAVKYPDPACDKAVKAIFTPATVKRLETTPYHEPFRLPYEAFDHLIALNIANMHAVSLRPGTVPDKATVKAAIENERTANGHTKPPIVQSKKSKSQGSDSGRRRAKRRRQRQSYPDHHSSSSSDSEDSWKGTAGDRSVASDKESNDDSSDGEKAKASASVYANQAVTPTSSEPDLSTPEGVLALVTQNMSTNTDKAKREDFLNLIETRNYDSSKGTYRNGATASLINKTTGIIQALKMYRHCCEAKAMSAFSFMMALAQGLPFARPGDFVPPIPDDEDPRLR